MWALVFLTMLSIFIFSSHDSKKSTQLSDKAFETVQEMVSDTTYADEISNLSASQKVEFILVIRKTAHILIYALLGFLLMGSFSLYEIKVRTRMIFSALVGVLYAISDEWHQTFVNGRSGRIADVGFDFCGVIIGIALMLVLISVINRIKKHKASA